MLEESSPFEATNLREVQRRETRARLYEAAIAEFERRGFDQTSISDIARKAGVSRSAFYAHFPTKPHVLLELQWRSERRICERLAAVSSLRDALRDLSNAMVDEFESIGGALARETMRIYLCPPDGALKESQQFPLFAEVSRWFAVGASVGELHCELQPARAARLCLTGMFGYLVATDADSDRRSELVAMTSLYLREFPAS